MYNNKKFLAVIPARGGSKRLPKKNILSMAGKPLISWTIDAALNSVYIDDIVVSSDSDEILKIAKDSGANLLKRPDYLSGDSATTFDAVKHVLDNFEEYDYVVLLQPTSPLRKSNHIDEAIKLLFKKNAEAIVSVTEAEHSPLWTNLLDKTLDMSNFLDHSIKNRRSQDLGDYYRLNGAIYIVDIKRFLDEKTFFLKTKIFAYIMDNISSVDIDNELDFRFAEFLLQR